jgi:hypothetical protein
MPSGARYLADCKSFFHSALWAARLRHSRRGISGAGRLLAYRARSGLSLFGLQLSWFILLLRRETGPVAQGRFLFALVFVNWDTRS